MEKVVKQPVMGSRWVTYLVTKENGTVVNEVLLHNSTYNGKAATIRRNTSGSVLSTEAETSSGESLGKQRSGGRERVCNGFVRGGDDGAPGTGESRGSDDGKPEHRAWL